MPPTSNGTRVPAVFSRKDRDAWAVVERLGRLLRTDEAFVAPMPFSFFYGGAAPASIHARHWPEPPRIIVFDATLAPEYPLAMRQAMARTHRPVLVAGRYAIFRRGLPSPWSWRLQRDLGAHRAALATPPRPAPEPAQRAAIVTTYGRPAHLDRCLASLARTGVPVLVVGDGSPTAAADAAVAERHGARHHALPGNRGVAAALNAGLAFWLADPDIAWISTFNDDVEVSPDLFERLGGLEANRPRPLLSGYHNRWHRRDPVLSKPAAEGEIPVRSAAGVHLHAHRDDWSAVMPIPTVALGAPLPGIAAEEDWWISTWAPRSAAKAGRPILVLPGLVETFSTGGADSTWGNAHDGR
jgi:hypothetical protein